MALINCPECGKEISDKAAACPACGYVLRENNMSCLECGAVIPEGATSCPNCGCPVGAYDEPAREGEGNPKKKKGGFVWLIIILAILVAVGWFIHLNQVKADTYNGFVDLYNTMLDCARETETAGNLVHDVWANSISKTKDETTDKFTRKDNGSGAFYTDFNDALGVLYEDEDFIEDAKDIYSARLEAEEQIKALAKHPDSFNEQYADFKECYNLFIKFVDLVLDPNGSLLDFTNRFNELDQDSANKFKELSIYFN